MFLISQARVISHNPPNGLQVIFKSMGQSPSFPVTVSRDYADARRVRQKPLPQIGTWGLVVFQYGDLRNGVWIGSYYPSKLDALTTTLASGFAETDPFIDYEASFSGDWWMLDGLGNYAHQYADSSYYIASGTSGMAFPSLPTLYRHIVDSSQKQQTIPYPYSDRVPNPPASGQPFFYGFKHGSGTQWSVDASGNVVVSGSASGTLTVMFGQATLTIDSSGLTTLALPGTETFNITQSGMAPTDAAVLVSKFLTAFNAHKHTGVDTGGGTSGPPATALTSGDVKSAIVNLSN